MLYNINPQDGRHLFGNVHNRSARQHELLSQPPLYIYCKEASRQYKLSIYADVDARYLKVARHDCKVLRYCHVLNCQKGNASSET
jgi:hypothetical protein